MGWVEVATVAFVAQLAVLPGEKVQFIIAGLSTRYDPRVVVAAAGSAFAIWTAIEIWVGAALKGAVPELYLDVATLALFLGFAAALVRSAPDGSGERERPAEGSAGVRNAFQAVGAPAVIGRRLPDYFGGFPPIFAMMFVGEFGDKTQLITIDLALQYGATSAIWVGEMLAIVPVSVANAFLFSRFVGGLDVRKAHFAGAALFCFFALDVALGLAFGFSPWNLVVGTLSDALT